MRATLLGPSVTVCITTHNDVHVLDNAVQSALDQTVAPREILVIDDGSDTPVAQHLHNLVRVVRITNRGLPAARNTALMLAQGEAFLPLDADDTIDPTYIEKTWPLLQAGADVVLVGLQEHGPTRNGTYMPGYDRPFNLVTPDDLARTNLFFYCALMRTATLRECGGYNPLMAGPWNQDGGYEDWDLWRDLMARGARFDGVNEVLLHYSTANEGSMVHRAERNRAALEAEMRRHHRV